MRCGIMSTRRRRESDHASVAAGDTCALRGGVCGLDRFGIGGGVLVSEGIAGGDAPGCDGDEGAGAAVIRF